MTTQATYDAFTGSAAEMYEKYFVPMIPAQLADRVFDLAALQPGERVLDVACGTGILARNAADRLGSDGRVAGIDVAPDMLDLARSLATASGVSIDWREATAESLPFDAGSFDVVLSQLGLMFVADKAAATREMHRVLSPDGRVVINAPGAIQPINEILDEAIARHINPDLAGFVGVVFSLHDPDEVGSYLTESGFSEVNARSEVATLRLPAPADYLWQYVNATPMGGFVAQASDEARAALEAEVVERWQPLVHGDGMVYDQPITWATARR